MVQPVDGGTDEQVVGAEAVPPLAHAVRLVDDEQRGVRAVEGGDDVGVAELLRRQQQHVQAPCGEVVQSLRLRLLRGGRVQRLDAVAVLAQALHLVALQGDGRADDECGPAEHARDRLVDRGLAGARGEDGDGVAAERGLDGLALPRAEVLDAGGLGRGLADDVTVLVQGRCVGGHERGRTRDGRRLTAHDDRQAAATRSAGSGSAVTGSSTLTSPCSQANADRPNRRRKAATSRRFSGCTSRWMASAPAAAGGVDGVQEQRGADASPLRGVRDHHPDVRGACRRHRPARVAEGALPRRFALDGEEGPAVRLVPQQSADERGVGHAEPGQETVERRGRREAGEQGGELVGVGGTGPAHADGSSELGLVHAPSQHLSA